MTPGGPPSRFGPYSKEALFGGAAPPPLRGKNLNQVAFPLGGIGTGCVSLTGRGALNHWEIFNRPNRNYRPDYAYFSVWARRHGEAPVFRVLEERIPPPYTAPEIGDSWRNRTGPLYEHGSGLPRMAACEFVGEYPLASIRFRDRKLPVQASLEAFSPFIPLNDADSSIPTAILLWTLQNRTRKTVEATVAFNMQNCCGYPDLGGNVNEFVRERRFCGLRMTSTKHAPGSPRFGSLALASPWRKVTWQCQWQTEWFMPQIHFADTFAATGRFDDDKSAGPSADGASWVGSLGLKVQLKPGESACLPFVLAWHFPTFEMYWDESGDEFPTWQNHYATRFGDAWEVAAYVVDNLARLERQTRQYHDALFASTLPACVIDAVSSSASVLKTPTCIRLPDGTLWGWEGCCSDKGCCPGSCTHVWQFSQAMPYLFPSLERTMRDAEYEHGLRESDGHVAFRLPLPLGRAANRATRSSAADGQFGGIVRVYRDWQISGDEEWLRRIWPKARRALAYAFKAWDKDEDGLLECPHGNTLDVEFHAPEPMCGTLYLAALRAGEEIARHLGDAEEAEHYRRIRQSGSAKMDSLLFNGEYYAQGIEPTTDIPYQYAQGCLVTQLIGQWEATMFGLGYLLDRRHVRTALKAIFRHNFVEDFSEFINPGNVFSANDEKGTVILTWPRGGRPAVPTPYASDTQCGYEYEAGAHMVWEGMLERGLTILRAVRDRHDGHRRNPWDEVECGHYYARSMANWSYLLGLAGFGYSAPRQWMRWAPQVNADAFRCFFSVAGAWGMYEQKAVRGGYRARLKINAGRLRLSALELGSLAGLGAPERASVRVGDRKVACEVGRGQGGVTLSFRRAVSVTQRRPMSIRLSSRGARTRA